MAGRCGEGLNGYHDNVIVVGPGISRAWRRVSAVWSPCHSCKAVYGALVKTILNWRGEEIEVARSRGGTLAVIDPFDNLVTTGVAPWPPPEIVQKLYKSRHDRAFDEPDYGAVTRALGFYSDLQSLHSEDTITWSVFGTVAHADQGARCAFTNSLLNLLGITIPTVKAANIWLWRRIPHPDTLTQGGPEIDFGIQTEQVVLLGEAKWLSGVGQAQGKARNKNQVTLRREFFEKYGGVIFGSASHYVLLGLSLRGGMLENEEINLGHATLYLRDVTWGSMCNIEGHPVSKEIRSYLKWKEEHSKAA